ncbi:MAG: hypothetical protein ACFFA3_20650 [Promethearchaeota archaeon]
MFNSGKEFNQKKLFLHFNGLIDKYMNRFVGKHKNKLGNFEKLQYLHNEFVYKAYYAYSILQRMKLMKEKAFKPQFEAIKPNLNLKNETEILYSSFLTREYMYFIMPFLNTVFLLQDRILLILGNYLKIKEKLPEKLPTYYYGYKEGNNLILTKFPETIQKLILVYWKKHGERIRSYRNLDQHHYNLSFHTFYRIKTKEEFVVYLPDKYSSNFEKLSYSKKIVALDYFESEFNAFHDLVESLAKSVDVNPKEFQPSHSLIPLEDLAQYENGELISIWIIGNEVIETRISKDNEPNSKAKRIEMKKSPNTVTEINWKFK